MPSQPSCGLALLWSSHLNRVILWVNKKKKNLEQGQAILPCGPSYYLLLYGKSLHNLVVQYRTILFALAVLWVDLAQLDCLYRASSMSLLSNDNWC